MSTHPAASGASLRKWITGEAQQHGFDAVAIANASVGEDHGLNLQAYVSSGYHGTMSWIAETLNRRSAPRALWPEVNSILVFAMSYAPDIDPLDSLGKKSSGTISVYARNRDYHDIIKGRLKTIASRFAARTGGQVKVFVDTAPVMEKPLAQAAGIGWQGKHTNLVSRQCGSWLFLGSIFTTVEFSTDRQEEDHCGSCRACLDICPTKAFPAPYQLDARRCISYLTIEHKEPIPSEFRKAMGNRIFGCDDCLAVCPWNKFAVETREAKLKARDELREPKLSNLLVLDDPEFRALFSGSPVKRIGRDRFIRNCLIAAGNSSDPSLVEICRTHLRDPSPLVRGAAVWALGQLLEATAFAALCEQQRSSETDPGVLEEWTLTGSNSNHGTQS